MANVFITPSIVAKTALATLYNTIVLASLVWRDFDADFSGQVGDTITVRKPAVFTAQEFDRNQGTQLQDATEDRMTITLDTIADVSFKVTSEDMTLEVQDFRAQLLNPAMEAIAQKIDGDCAEALVDGAHGAGGGGNVAMTSVPHDVFTGAEGLVSKMGRAKAPLTQRYMILSPEGQGIVLGDDLFIQAQQAGSTDGLRNASVGRTFGFDNYMTQTLGFGAGDRGKADAVAFHNASLILATRPLAAPMGLAPNQYATEAYKSLALRVVYQYNRNLKQDEISVDMLFGTKIARPEFTFDVDFGAGS